MFTFCEVLRQTKPKKRKQTRVRSTDWKSSLRWVLHYTELDVNESERDERRKFPKILLHKKSRAQFFHELFKAVGSVHRTARLLS